MLHCVGLYFLTLVYSVFYVFYLFAREMIENKGCRLVVNINDLRKSNPERATGLLNACFEEVAAFQR